MKNHLNTSLEINFGKNHKLEGAGFNPSIRNTTYPQDWCVKSLKELGAFSKGKGILKEQVIAEGIPCIRYGEIYTTHDFVLSNFTSFINNEVAKESKQIRKGDLLFAGSGETIEEIGKSIAYVGEYVAFAGGDIIILSTYNDVNPECLSYALESDSAKRQKRIMGQGNSVVHIYASDLAKLKVALPPPREQEAIAKVLNHFNNSITQNNKLIAQKELRKKWLMQNLLTGKKRLQGFEREWKEVRIKELFSEVARYVKWDEQNTYRLVSIRRRFGGLFERGDFFGHQIGVKKLKSVNANDFLISKRQVSHGAWAVVTADFHDTQVSDEYDCLAIKDESKLDIKFWNWFSKNTRMSHYAYLASNGVHIEKLIFDFDTFKKRKVLIPSSIEEQVAIAKILDAADKEIQLLKAKTEKLREQKKGMMQVLLTGKKRLKLDTYENNRNTNKV